MFPVHTKHPFNILPVQKILFLGLMSLLLQEQFLLAIDKTLPVYNSISAVAGITVGVNTLMSTNWMKYSRIAWENFKTCHRFPAAELLWQLVNCEGSIT